MKSKLAMAVGTLWIASAATPAASPDDPRRQLFSRDVLVRAVANLDTVKSPRQGPSGDWSRVRALVGVEVLISTVGAPARDGVILGTDDATVTVRVRGGTRARIQILQIPRADVLEVKRWIRRGSVFGAFGGTVAGFVAGYYGFLWFGYSQCGGSCVDQAVLAMASLAGLPLAGGLTGYHAVGRRVLTTVYVRPGS